MTSQPVRRRPGADTPASMGPGAGASVGARAGAGTARGLALKALVAVDRDGARANIVVPELLAGAALAERDRAFVTELVYGTVRMQRACDWLIDRHLQRPVQPVVRAALRLGAYQMAMLGTPPHAAVSATVSEMRGPARGLVNAVLRRVAEAVAAGVAWPSAGVQLSYPDWIEAELASALGHPSARQALEQMNVAARVTARADGYIQDRASQWAAGAVVAGELRPGERILDLCAAPGGKATWLAGGGRGGRPPAIVVAADRDRARAALVAGNVARLRLDNVATVVADGTRPPFAPATFDRVLVDAPCTGLGVLRRRPDARWRVRPDDVARLARLQRRLLDAALTLVRPGGLVVYTVCTLTSAETTDIDTWLAASYPEAGAVNPRTLVGEAWDAVGRGARLLPQTAGTDGMFLLALRSPGPDDRSGRRRVDSPGGGKGVAVADNGAAGEVA